MEKIPQSLSKEFLPLKLYVEDLEAIEAVLKDLLSEEIRIETGEFSFNNIEELAAHFDNHWLTELKITTYRPYYIYIEFTKMWARVYCASDDTQASGAFYKIQNILNNGLRKPSLAYSYYSIFAINILVASVVSFTSHLKLAAVLMVAPIWYIWAAWVLYIRMRRHSYLVITRQSHISSFWHRNKDQIIVGILIAVMSIIGTMTITNYNAQITNTLHSVISRVFESASTTVNTK